MVIELASTPRAIVIVRVKCRLTGISSLYTCVNVGLGFFVRFWVSCGSMIAFLFLYVSTRAYGSIDEYFFLLGGYVLSCLSVESGEPRSDWGMLPVAQNTCRAVSGEMKKLQAIER